MTSCLPSCSKHCQLNKLVKRSTSYVFYDFITKYLDLLLKKREKLLQCNAKASHTSTKIFAN